MSILYSYKSYIRALDSLSDESNSTQRPLFLVEAILHKVDLLSINEDVPNYIVFHSAEDNTLISCLVNVKKGKFHISSIKGILIDMPIFISNQDEIGKWFKLVYYKKHGQIKFDSFLSKYPISNHSDIALSTVNNIACEVISKFAFETEANIFYYPTNSIDAPFLYAFQQKFNNHFNILGIEDFLSVEPTTIGYAHCPSLLEYEFNNIISFPTECDTYYNIFISANELRIKERVFGNFTLNDILPSNITNTDFESSSISIKRFKIMFQTDVMGNTLVITEADGEKKIKMLKADISYEEYSISNPYIENKSHSINIHPTT